MHTDSDRRPWRSARRWFWRRTRGCQDSGHGLGCVTDLGVVDTEEIEPGGRVRLCLTGGAGYGSPLDRHPSGVLDGVLDGIVSVDGAREDYGVILAEETDGLVVDREATDELRRRRRTGREEGSERRSGGLDDGP